MDNKRVAYSGSDLVVTKPWPMRNNIKQLIRLVMQKRLKLSNILSDLSLALATIIHHNATIIRSHYGCVSLAITRVLSFRTMYRLEPKGFAAL
jgi:hypothetical protein